MTGDSKHLGDESSQRFFSSVYPSNPNHIKTWFKVNFHTIAFTGKVAHNPPRTLVCSLWTIWLTLSLKVCLVTLLRKKISEARSRIGKKPQNIKYRGYVDKFSREIYDYISFINEQNSDHNLNLLGWINCYSHNLKGNLSETPQLFKSLLLSGCSPLNIRWDNSTCYVNWEKYLWFT